MWNNIPDNIELRADGGSLHRPASVLHILSDRQASGPLAAASPLRAHQRAEAKNCANRSRVILLKCDFFDSSNSKISTIANAVYSDIT